MQELKSSARSSRKWEIWLIASIVLVAMLFVAFFWTTSATSKRVGDTIAAIKARGEPVTLDDLIPMPIPDDVNAALAYDKAIRMLPASGSNSKDSDTIKSFIDRDKRLQNPELWRDARIVIDKQRSLFTTLAAASNMPDCQFPVKWEPAYATLFPHYGPLRELSRWNAANALLEAKAGDMDAAVDSIETGIKMSDSVNDEHLLISILLRVSMLQNALTSLHDCVELRPINTVQARRLDAALAHINMADGFVNGMMGERAQGFGFFDDVQCKRITNVGALYADNNVLSYASRIWGTAMGRPLLNSDKVYYARFMTKQVELARMPFYRYEKARKKVSLDPYKDAPKYALLSRLLCPVFIRARLVSDTADANVAVTRAGLGLIVYHERYGCFPQSLGELKAKLGWNVPKDPFTGKSLIYKHTETSFTVYSIGSNTLDDGGKAPGPKGRPTDGDVVWKYSLK